MADKQQRLKMSLWHLTGNYADKAAALWPGGAGRESPEGVNPVAEALVMVTHREGEITSGKLDEVQLLLQDREEPFLKRHIRIEAHIYNIGGVVTTTSEDTQISREMDQEAARQVYDHYLDKYGGQPIYLLSRKDMENTTAVMLLEDAQPEDP